MIYTHLVAESTDGDCLQHEYWMKELWDIKPGWKIRIRISRCLSTVKTPVVIRSRFTFEIMLQNGGVPGTTEILRNPSKALAGGAKPERRWLRLLVFSPREQNLGQLWKNDRDLEKLSEYTSEAQQKSLETTVHCFHGNTLMA